MKRFYRIVSLIVVAAFSVTGIPVLPPAYAAAQNLSSDSHTMSPFPKNTGEISLPRRLGSVLDFHQGSGTNTVILIQDAHAIPEAQRSIWKIIEFFQDTYGPGPVAVEGASSELDTEIFRSFPDRKKLEQVFEEYLERGELTGPLAAAVFSRNEAGYHGMENWKLYETGLRHYLAALESREEILKELGVLVFELEEKKKRLYSPGLLEIDAALNGFLQNKGDLIKVLQKLAEVQPPEKGSEIELLIRESQKQESSRSLFDAEVEKAAGEIKEHLSKDARLRNDLTAFNRKHQEYKTSQSSAESFAAFLKELIERDRLSVRLSSALEESVRNHKKIRDIEGTKLFSDFEKYVKEVKEKLFRNQEERRLDDEGRVLFLLQKLAKLELTYEEWKEIESTRKSFPLSLSEQRTLEGAQAEDAAILHEEKQPDFSFPPETAKDLLNARLVSLNSFKSHTAFYQNAERRDEVFFRNLMKLMEIRSGFALRAPDFFAAPSQSRISGPALFVAGGFHTRGLTQKLKEKGISYAVVMPHIGHLPEHSRYQELMRGEVSWKDYFDIEDGRVNLYDAFVRGTRDRLLTPGIEGAGQSGPLKLWRDQLIRSLAERGKAARAGDYTVFLDEIAGSGFFQSKPWFKKVERFAEGLRRLESESSLTEQNVMLLLRSAAAAHPGSPGVSETPAFRPAAFLQAVGNASAVRGATIEAVSLAPGSRSGRSPIASGTPLGPDGLRSGRTLIASGTPLGPDGLRSELRAEPGDAPELSKEELIIKLWMAYQEELMKWVTPDDPPAEMIFDPSLDQRRYSRVVRALEGFIKLFGEQAVFESYHRHTRGFIALFVELVYVGLDDIEDAFNTVLNVNAVKKAFADNPAALKSLFFMLQFPSSFQIADLQKEFPSYFEKDLPMVLSYEEIVRSFAIRIEREMPVVTGRLSEDFETARWGAFISEDLHADEIEKIFSWLTKNVPDPILWVDLFRDYYDESPLAALAALSVPIRRGWDLSRIDARNLTRTPRLGFDMFKRFIFGVFLMEERGLDLTGGAMSLQALDALMPDFELYYEREDYPRSELRTDANAGIQTVDDFKKQLKEIRTDKVTKERIREMAAGDFFASDAAGIAAAVHRALDTLGLPDPVLNEIRKKLPPASGGAELKLTRGQREDTAAIILLIQKNFGNVIEGIETVRVIQDPVRMIASRHFDAEDGKWAAAQIREMLKGEDKETPVTLWLENAWLAGSDNAHEHFALAENSFAAAGIRIDLKKAILSGRFSKYEDDYLRTLYSKYLTLESQSPAEDDLSEVSEEDFLFPVKTAVRELREEGWNILVKKELISYEAFIAGLRKKLYTRTLMETAVSGRVDLLQSGVMQSMRYFYDESKLRDIKLSEDIAAHQTASIGGLQIILRGSAHRRLLAHYLGQAKLKSRMALHDQQETGEGDEGFYLREGFPVTFAALGNDVTLQSVLSLVLTSIVAMSGYSQDPDETAVLADTKTLFINSLSGDQLRGWFDSMLALKPGGIMELVSRSLEWFRTQEFTPEALSSLEKLILAFEELHAPEEDIGEDDQGAERNELRSVEEGEAASPAGPQNEIKLFEKTAADLTAELESGEEERIKSAFTRVSGAAGHIKDLYAAVKRQADQARSYETEARKERLLALIEDFERITSAAGRLEAALGRILEEHRGNQELLKGAGEAREVLARVPLWRLTASSAFGRHFPALKTAGEGVFLNAVKGRLHEAVSRSELRAKLPYEISGVKAARVFEKAGWKLVRTKGHLIMVKEGAAEELSIPKHHALRAGALRSAIRKAGMTVEEFRELYHKPKRDRASRRSELRQPAALPDSGLELKTGGVDQSAAAVAEYFVNGESEDLRTPVRTIVSAGAEAFIQPLYAAAGRAAVLRDAQHAAAAEGYADLILSLSQTVVVEYRISSEDVKLMDGSEQEIIENLIAMAYNTAAAEENAVIRIVLPDNLKVQKGRNKEDKARTLYSGGMVLIYNSGLEDFARYLEAPAAITVTSGSVEGKLLNSRSFGNGEAADYEAPETAAQFLAAALIEEAAAQALSERTFRLLAQDPDKPNVYLVPTPEDLSSMTYLAYAMAQYHAELKLQRSA